MKDKITKNKNKSIIYIFFIGILIISTLFIRFKQQKHIQYSSNPVIQNVFKNTSSILSNNSSDYKSSLSFSDTESLWWNTEDGFSISVPNSPSLVLTTPCLSYSPYSQSEVINKNISPKIRDWFIDNGFNINKLNSSDSYADTKFYDYIEAFEKDNVKCTLVSNLDCESASENHPMENTLTLVCTDQFDEHKSEQEPLLKSLNIKNSIIWVRESVDGFVNLAVYGRRTGYYIIAKETARGWDKIWAGQEPPPCNLVRQYQIPAKIEDSCYENDELVHNNFFN